MVDEPNKEDNFNPLDDNLFIRPNDRERDLENGSVKSKDFDFDLDFLAYSDNESSQNENNNKEENNENENNENENNENENNENNEIPDNDFSTIKCAYCSITNQSHLIKCKECNRWFCNGKLDSFSPSHIVFHLTKSKHKEVFLNNKSNIGEMDLECYNCNGKNIFLLGFLQSNEGNSGMFVCREPCLTTCKFDDSKFNKQKWISLINDKQLLDWIVPPPNNDIEIRMNQRINIRSMSKMEDKWEKEKLLASQEKPKYIGNYLKSVKLCYNDGQDYLDIFEPLISAEEEYDRKLKETQKKTNINTKFYQSGKKIIAKFPYPREDNEIKLVPGDELKITDPKSGRNYRGFVIDIEIEDIIHLELDMHKSSNKNSLSNDIESLQDGNFTIEFVWKGTSFKRMLDGLYIFVNEESSVSNYIYSKILGHTVDEKKFSYNIPKDLSVKGLPQLNYFQTLGIKKALITPLFLIQGPPGTGKTVTSAAIVYHLVNLKVGKVLVCAPSNIAADQLSEKIEKIGLNVIRVCAKSRESISSRVEHLSLHNQLKKLSNKKEYKRLFAFMKKKEEEGNVLTNKEHEIYKKLKTKAEDEIIQGATVVVTTCISSFDKRLDNFRFPIVLIDEATQACESECILPLLRGAKHAILVGDHCQLGPVVLCKNAAKAGLKISLFERLVKLKIKPHMLQVQYRMHPKLSEFPSNTFYDGNLQNGVSADERFHFNVNFPWPNNNKPTFFYHIVGTEEFSASGTSYINRQEADMIGLIVKTFMKCTVKAEQIGIITPYEGQRCYIVSHISKNIGITEIEVASVDSFQGREKDYIILSCVRSNDHNGIGFLDDPRRLNVALTRARYGLVIVGNAMALAKHQLWSNLLYHYKEMGLLVEGQLGSFKELIITLQPPRRYIPEKMSFERENQNLNMNSTFTSVSNTNNNDLSISYNMDLNSNNKNINAYEELFNNATLSRFSDFGYTNDTESVTHFNKVVNVLRKNPITINNEFIVNKYEQFLMNFNKNLNYNNGNNMKMFNPMNNLVNNPMNNPMINPMNNPMINPMVNPFFGFNNNLFINPGMWKMNNKENNNTEKNDNNNLMNKYGMNYSRVLLNERKFVMETEF